MTKDKRLNSVLEKNQDTIKLSFPTGVLHMYWNLDNTNCVHIGRQGGVDNNEHITNQPNESLGIKH